MNFGKEKILEFYPNAICESVIPTRFANCPKHVLKRETYYAVTLAEDNPQVSGKRFTGHSAQKAWESASKWFDNPTYN